MKTFKKIVLITLTIIPMDTLFAPPPANTQQEAVRKLLGAEPKNWTAEAVTDVLSFLATDKNPDNTVKPENKTAYELISQKWTQELKLRAELKRAQELKELEERKCKEDLKCREELRRREKFKPSFTYEAADTHRMPKVINEVLQPLKEIQQHDQQDPTGKTAQTMPKRLTKKQRSELEQLVRGAGLAYEILALDNALAEFEALKNLPENAKADEILRLNAKQYPDIEEQTLNYTRTKAYQLVSDDYYKEISQKTEPRFKKLLVNSFNIVLKGKSLGEQKEKELDNARLAVRFSQSKESGYDSALARDLIAASKAIRELGAIDKNLSQEKRLNQAMNTDMRSINNATLKEVVEKIYKDITK